MSRLIVLDPYRVRAVAFWMERAPRERVLLAALGALAIVALLLTLVVRPLQAARAQALADIRTYETLNAGLRAAGTNAAAGPRRTGSATEIATASSASFGLAITRIEPEGSGVRVTLDNAPYDAVVNWLADLARTSDLRAADVRLERRPVAGAVNAQILLAAGGR
jgi:general secretion pathway protein M